MVTDRSAIPFRTQSGTSSYFNFGSSRNSSGRIQGMKAQESCAFVSELDFGEGFDLASEMDDKSGEATWATLGFLLLSGFSAGTDSMRRFR